MQLLYLDDSGSVQNRTDTHIILAGLAVGERDPHWIAEDMDKVAAKVWPDNPDGLEFRGADIFSGKKHWRGQGKQVRIDAYREVLRVIADRRTVRLFGAAIRRDACGLEDPIEFAFEVLTSRFDHMLARMYRANNTQRGLIILDESTYETSLQARALNFRRQGHRWGKPRNFVEVPLFVDSRASRMIQAADLIAYALRRAYERNELEYLDILKPRFDAVGGIVYGLHHQVPQEERCNCHSCENGPKPPFPPPVLP